jgi:hypothetical protein
MQLNQLKRCGFIMLLGRGGVGRRALVRCTLSDLKQLIRDRKSIAEFLYRNVGEVEAPDRRAPGALVR